MIDVLGVVMASFLEKQLSKAIAKGLKGKLLVGTLQRQTATTLNSFGDPVPATPQSFRVEGFPDEYSDYYRAQVGIPEGAVKLIIIAGNSATFPLKEDIVTFPGFPDFKIQKTKIDPAKAAYECQAFRVNDGN